MRRMFTIFCLIVVSFGVFEMSAQNADELLKKAKKEGLFFGDKELFPRLRKGDDAKYIVSRDAAGHEWVDRRKISEDLFKMAADAGSGEAAYILFCYHCFGKYDGKEVFSMNPKNSDTDQWKKYFMQGKEWLQRAVDLNYPDAMEYYVIENEGKCKNDVELAEAWMGLYDAMSGDPIAQMNQAGRYKSTNPIKYEYWMKKSLSHKEWPLLARTEYANWLLDDGKRAEALKIMEPAEKKTDYYKDKTASYGSTQEFVFYVADCIYEGQLEKGIRYCEHFFRNHNYSGSDLTRYHKLNDVNYLEYCLSYHTWNGRKRLFEKVYEMNPNPIDSLLVYNRGLAYETWGDSIQAFNHYKRSALDHHPEAMIKMFDYASKGHSLSDEEMAKACADIIREEEPVTGNLKIAVAYADWRIYYVLGEYFYNSGKDYRKAFLLYAACFDAPYVPSTVKGVCARQLFKCYEFGRGVEQDHEKAEAFMNEAQKIGDESITDIYEALYPKRE